MHFVICAEVTLVVLSSAAEKDFFFAMRFIICTPGRPDTYINKENVGCNWHDPAESRAKEPDCWQLCSFTASTQFDICKMFPVWDQTNDLFWKWYLRRKRSGEKSTAVVIVQIHQILKYLTLQGSSIAEILILKYWRLHLKHFPSQ